MKPARIIPVLLLRGDGLVKGVRFKDHRYVGDPINAVKIFNDKEVDELVFLDITATIEQRPCRLELVQHIADECYMPFGVGGGVRSVEDIRMLLNSGAEKVCINTAAVATPELIREASATFGSQSIVVAIDVRQSWRGVSRVYTHAGRNKTALEPVEWARRAAELGAGEILLTSVDRDGTHRGFDLDLLRAVSAAVDVPVIACGGAGCYRDLSDAVASGGASAVAAGSLFVFYGKHKAVLITYPDAEDLQQIWQNED